MKTKKNTKNHCSQSKSTFYGANHVSKNVIFPHKREKTRKTRKSRFARNHVFVMALRIITIKLFILHGYHLTSQNKFSKKCFHNTFRNSFRNTFRNKVFSL